MEVLKIYLIFKTSIIPNSNMSNTCKPSNLSFIQRIQLNDGVALKKIFPEKNPYEGYVCVVEDLIQSSGGKVLQCILSFQTSEIDDPIEMTVLE